MWNIYKVKMKVIKFIEQANKVHFNYYDYSLTEYFNSRTKVKIICSIHGIFEQLPLMHLKGQKCPKCALIIRAKKKIKTNDKFILEAKVIHGDIYDYSKTEYIKASEYVTITCLIHGDFKQKPSCHLTGNGCRWCGIESTKNKNTKNLNEFITQATNIHKNKYDYSKVEYINRKTKVCIICPLHGEFWQTPSNHLHFQCKLCEREETTTSASKNPTGWSKTNWERSAKLSKNFDSYKVYVIRCWDNDEEFYKIGRTYRKLEERFKSKIPYNYEIITKFIFLTAKEAFDREVEMKRLHKNLKYKPKIIFGGYTECFTNYLKN